MGKNVETDVGGLIGRRFIEKKLITDAQLRDALNEQKRTGELLVKILLRHSYVSEEDAVSVLADHIGVQACPLATLRIDAEVRALVPEDLARKHSALPILLDGDALTVAMSNPLDVVAIDHLRLVTGRHIHVMAAGEREIEGAIDRNYGPSGSSENGRMGAQYRDASGSRGIDLHAAAHSFADEEPEQRGAEDVSAIKVVDGIMERAVQKDATDIHLEPEEKLVRVRFRIDGVLEQEATFPKSLQSGLTTRLKIMCGMSITENRLPQDGRAMWSLNQKRIDLRASTFPTVFGEAIALRILNRDSLVLGLERLGLSAHSLSLLEPLIMKPYGIILVTGPTGSGKTTTLYSILARLDAPKKNIMTLEDPIEYELPRIRQSQVNPRGGLTFAVGLRAMLRQDPDVILVGEIRDTETAELAIRSALTGHLVFSTLHTNDSVGAIPRLRDMGVQPYLIASSLTAVLAQRLVRRICSNCKVSEPPPPAYERMLQFPHNGSEGKPSGTPAVSRGAGCARCHGSGYRGRVGIFELFIVTDAVRTLIVEQSDGRRLRECALAERMVPMFDDGVEKVKLGVTTLEEVLQATQVEDAVEADKPTAAPAHG